jgi:signal transduction histidine kinase
VSTLRTLRWVLFSFLVLSSAAILYATTQNTRTARFLADEALRSTALGLAASAASELRDGSASIREILSDRVLAYALIVKPDGLITFHTNPALAGTRLTDPEVPTWFASRRPGGHRVQLGTGLPAYRFHYPLHGGAGQAEMLLLALQTVEVDRILSHARDLWWVVGGVLCLLWGVGIALERTFSRQFRLQEEMVGREKLALIGQMTATLAHEIRNALGSVKGFAQWVDGKLRPTDDLRRGTGAILMGTARIETLVDDLLAYSRDEAYRISPVNAGKALGEALGSAVEGWRGQVDMEGELDLLVAADEDKLQRVLVNGIRNALEAMGNQGTLRLSASGLRRQAEFRIEDTGPGISEESADRIFTPFFTTKANGTGLGLAYSKKVMEGMGGRIALVNRPGGGAVLSLVLPNHGET